jgi:hypothetical protein
MNSKLTNIPKYQILCHKKSPPQDLYKMTDLNCPFYVNVMQKGYILFPLFFHHFPF